MNTDQAIKVFNALGHKSRLDLLRKLIVAGSEGLTVGQLADATDQNIKTVSAQLLLMANTAVLHFERQGKSVIYRVNFETMSAMFAFLMNDCCAGDPELRQKVLKACC